MSIQEEEILKQEKEKDVKEEQKENNKTEQEELIESLKSENAKANERNNQLLYSLSALQNSMKIQEKNFEIKLNNEIKKIITEVISILEILEFALENKPEDEGISMMIKSVEKILKKNNIEEIEVKIKDKFDYNLHDSITAQEDENFETNQIIKIVKKGYKFKDSVVKCAQVIIAK